MLASFMLSVDFNSVSWEGVKFRGRACQRRDCVMEITAGKAIRDMNIFLQNSENGLIMFS